MRGLILSDIVFGGALAFMLGVASAGLLWNTGLLMAITAVAGFTALFFYKRLNLWRSALLFLFCVAVGAFYFHLYANIKAASENYIFDKKLDFSGIVADEPQVSEKYVSFVLGLDPPLAGKIKVYADFSPAVHYGDKIEMNGVMARAIGGKMPESFFPEIEVKAEHKGFWLKEKLLNFKSALLSQFPRSLSSEESALLGGLTLGARADFSKEFKGQMAASGTTHLVALSGYNISILVLAIAATLGRFLSRRKTFYITTAIIALFVLMVGAEASVVRAAIMGFLVLLSREVGKIYSVRNAIVLSAFLMTLQNPAVLTGDAGFQLSFMSLLGIVYLNPAIKLFLRMKEEPTGWRETSLLTLSAQLAVMPIIIMVFGQFSLTAIFANVLILEFVPLTMFLGFLLAGLNIISIYLGFVVAKLAEILLTYEIFVIKFFAAARLPVGSPFGSSVFMIFFYYIILAAFVYYYFPRPQKL